VKGIAKHGLPLAEERNTAGIVTVPERQLEIFQDRPARHHRSRPAVPHGGAKIGALVIVRGGFLVAGQGGHFSVEEQGVAVIVWRKKTLPEENDRITTEQDRGGRHDYDQPMRPVVRPARCFRSRREAGGSQFWNQKWRRQQGEAGGKEKGN
jgi:hypothetical protein